MLRQFSYVYVHQWEKKYQNKPGSILKVISQSKRKLILYFPIATLSLFFISIAKYTFSIMALHNNKAKHIKENCYGFSIVYDNGTHIIAK